MLFLLIQPIYEQDLTEQEVRRSEGSDEFQRSMYSPCEHARCAFLSSEKIVFPELSLGMDRAFRYIRPYKLGCRIFFLHRGFSFLLMLSLKKAV